jgi:preprotein translocase subunit SecE
VVFGETRSRKFSGKDAGDGPYGIREAPVHKSEIGFMAKTSPVEFFQQVRQEVSRVTWPSRKETVVTTAMVFVMVFIAAAFFFVVDQVFSAGVRLIFGLGH